MFDTIFDGLVTLVETLRAQFINVPINSDLGWLYAILNLGLLALAYLFGSGNANIDLFPYL